MNLRFKYACFTSLLATSLFVGGAAAQDTLTSPQPIIHRINPYQNRQSAAPTAGSTGQITPVITYHNGPIMATPNIYLIWYGNWNQSNGSDTAAGQQLVRDFFYGLSGSPYYQTNTSYSGVSGHFTLAGEYTVAYPNGTRLSDSAIQTIVSSAISGGHLAKSSNGIYFVLTSSDVTETSGFCTRYCGWHTHGTISGTDIKYAFVGNANRCLSACADQSIGPNGNAGVDGMVSVLAHETEETNTDLDLNAWYNSQGSEDGDMCAWTFGQNPTQLPSGAYYNMTLPKASGGTNNYLIQRELDSTSKCYVNYVTKAQ